MKVDYQVTLWDSLTGETSQHIITLPAEIAEALDDQDPSDLVELMHTKVCEVTGENPDLWIAFDGVLASKDLGVIISAWNSVVTPNSPHSARTIATETIMRLAPASDAGTPGPVH